VPARAFFVILTAKTVYKGGLSGFSSSFGRLLRRLPFRLWAVKNNFRRVLYEEKIFSRAFAGCFAGDEYGAGGVGG
jgi:hypothetical protein